MQTDSRPDLSKPDSRPDLPRPDKRPDCPKLDKRPDWDQYFMEIAHQVARRTTCRRRAVGAVIVKDRRILSTGYNGVPQGIEHCLDRGCLREQLGIPSGKQHELCRGLHAEQNAIIQAARHGISIDGAMVYCTTQPCIICAKMLINSGITEIVFEHPYPDELTEGMLAESGVATRCYVGTDDSSVGIS